MTVGRVRRAQAARIADLTFKILAMGWSDWRNATLEEVGTRTVTNLPTNNVVTKEAESFHGPTMSVSYPQGSMYLVRGGRTRAEGKGECADDKMLHGGFIRTNGAGRLTQF